MYGMRALCCQFEVLGRLAPVNGIDASAMRSDLCGRLGRDDAGRSVTVCGWVDRRREHSEHLAFVDLRDRSGVLQCVVDGARELRSEYVLRITGTVRLRPTGSANPALATGEVELAGLRRGAAVAGPSRHRSRSTSAPRWTRRCG